MATPRSAARRRIAGSSTISRRARLYAGCVATGPGTPSRSAICQACSIWSGVQFSVPHARAAPARISPVTMPIASWRPTPSGGTSE
jgi:hypothetical protein